MKTGNPPPSRNNKPMNDPDYFLELQVNTGWGRVLSRFAEWVDPKPGARLLDIGCGPGLLPAIFSKTRIRAFGIDNELGMFQNGKLHNDVAVGDISCLPFNPGTFDILTVSNLLFLMSDPGETLSQVYSFLAPGGELAMLNPSEFFTVSAAEKLVVERGLSGLARETLINWAQRAEQNFRWSDIEISKLLSENQFQILETTVFMGPGFVRVVRAEKLKDHS